MNDDIVKDDNLVFDSKLDGRFRCRVIRTKPYYGLLMVEDDDKDGKLIISQEVGLAYNAEFGPDVEDLDAWHTMITDYIDREYLKPGALPGVKNALVYNKPNPGSERRHRVKLLKKRFELAE